MKIDNIFLDFSKSIFVYGISDAVSKLIALFVIPIYLSLMTPEQFGLLEVLTISISFLTFISNFGFNNALNRFFFEGGAKFSDQKLMFSTGLIFLVSVNIFTFIIYLLTLIFFLDEVYFRELSQTVIIVGLLLVPLSSLISFNQTLSRMRFNKVDFTVSNLVGFALYPIISVLIMMNTDYRIGAIFFSSALCLAVSNIYLVIKNISFIGLDFSMKIFKKFFNFGFPFIFTSFAFWAFSSVDRYLIAHFLGLESVGQYAVASKIAFVPLIVFTAFGAAWSPLVMKLKENYSDKKFRNFLGSSLSVIIIIGLLCSGFFALFAGEIMGALFPEQYLKNAEVSVLLIFAVLLNFSTQGTAMGITISNQSKYIAIITFISLVANVLGNYFLIPLFGNMGAGISTLASYLLLTSLYMHRSQKLYKIHVRLTNIMPILAAVALTFFISFHFFSLDFTYALAPKILTIFLLISILVIYLKKFIKSYA